MLLLLGEAASTPGTCRPEVALSRVRARVRALKRSDGGVSFAVFFERLDIKDSSAVQIVSADFVTVLRITSTPRRATVALVLDPERALWTRQIGLLEALCDL